MAEKIKEQIEAGEYGKATNSWGDLENYIISNSNSVVRYSLSILMSTFGSYCPFLFVTNQSYIMHHEKNCMCISVSLFVSHTPMKLTSEVEVLKEIRNSKKSYTSIICSPSRIYILYCT